MKPEHNFSITLPAEVAEQIGRRVRSGAYRSADDVIRDGIEALVDRDEAIERWLREEVVTGHEEYMADPSSGVSAELVVERIKARRTSSGQR